MVQKPPSKPEERLATLEQRLKRVQQPHANSQQLDNIILSAAEETAKRRKRANQQLRECSIQPAGFASLVLGSVVTTALTLMLMADWIMPDGVTPDRVTPDRVTPDGVTLAAPEVGFRASQPSDQQITLSEVSRPADPKYLPDQILLELSLPSVPDLVRSMEFVAEADRSEATIQLISALADIEYLIEIGHLNDARERYDRLRERCYSCQLPRSLEALAVSSHSSRSSG